MYLRIALSASFALILGIAVLTAAAALTPQQADAFARKVAIISQQGTLVARTAGARRTPVSESEVNSWFAYRARPLLPVGMSEPQLTIIGDGKVSGAATVDLDAVGKSKRTGSLIDPWSLLGGRLPVTVTGVLRTQNGQGRFELQQAAVSGVPIPKSLLQELVSYAAATSRRGVRVVRCPTTVLAQAAVRTATFEPPLAVVNDLEFLTTASPRAALAGIAAAVRIALLRDASFFEWLASHASSLRAREPDVLATMVRRAAENHLELAPDRREDPGDGDAVAVACAVDAAYSAMCGLLDHEALDTILTTLEALGLPTYHPALEASFDLAVTLLEDIGRGGELIDVDRELSLRAIDWLRRRC